MLEKGTVISKRYQIMDRLGSGGMAVAYKARDMRLGRFVTIKVLKEEYAENAEFLTKFSSEASAAASLSHHNIVRVYDVGEDRGINYIVMEYVHGQSLKKTIQEKAPFDTLTTLSVAMQIASALSHAHKHHVVHRDIKPQNILVAVDGTVKVTDFGIARAATTNTYAADVNAMGSVHYFSPEQARGGFVNEKSDIYSLGITMYEMATGHVPFDASSSIAIALKHLNEELPDIKQYNANVTRGLEGIIRKATQKKADERYDNIEFLMSDLKLAIIEAARVAKNGKQTEASQPLTDTPVRRKTAERKRVENEKEEMAENNELENTIEPNNQMAGQLSLGETMADSYEEDYADGYREEYDSYSDDDNVNETQSDELKVELARNIKLPKSSVGFEKYGKKLKLNNQYDTYDNDDGDDYDDDYNEDFDDYYKEFDEEKRQERKVTIAAVITALVLIGVIVFVGIKFFNVFDNAAAVFNRSKTVPNFVGKTMEIAMSEAEELGITLIEGSVVDSEEAKDTILTQDVDEGVSVTENMEIIVSVSSGADTEVIPDVVGDEESAAITKITEKLKANIVIEYDYDENSAEGTVIRQRPEGNTRAAENADIVLTICRSQDNLNTVVPKVEGLSESEAKSKIDGSGLTVGNVSYTTSTSVEKGYVITQTVTAGEEVLKNSSIDIVVSSGRPAAAPASNSNSSTNNNSNTTRTTNTEPSDNSGQSEDVPVLGSN